MKFKMEKSVFETLLKINVNDQPRASARKPRPKKLYIYVTLAIKRSFSFVLMKNGLSYLSWPYAWAEVKKRFPEANYKVYETELWLHLFHRRVSGRTGRVAQ